MSLRIFFLTNREQNIAARVFYYIKCRLPGKVFTRDKIISLPCEK